MKSWSPGAHPPSTGQDGSAFLSNWDPQHPGPPAPWVPEPPLQPSGGRVQGTVPGPGSQWGVQLASVSRQEQKRESCCPHCPKFVSRSGQVTIPRQEKNMKVSVTQSCPTLCDPMDCGPTGPSVHGILQARTLGWGNALLQGIFPAQGLNLGFPHCRQILQERPLPAGGPSQIPSQGPW